MGTREIDDAGRAMNELLPGEPGWDAVATAAMNQPYDPMPYHRGSYLTVSPNLMLNVFPDAALAMWVEPLSINSHGCPSSAVRTRRRR